MLSSIKKSLTVQIYCQGRIYYSRCHPASWFDPCSRGIPTYPRQLTYALRHGISSMPSEVHSQKPLLSGSHHPGLSLSKHPLLLLFVIGLYMILFRIIHVETLCNLFRKNYKSLISLSRTESSSGAVSPKFISLYDHAALPMLNLLKDSPIISYHLRVSSADAHSITPYSPQ